VALAKGCKQLVADAMTKVRTLTLDEAKARLGSDDVLFVDIREARELEREGMIPGAFHAPRGMLEFWVDPESPYFKDALGGGKDLVLYCQSAWRSSLAAATLQDMGLTRVCHIAGGFKAWKAAGLPTSAKPPGARH